MLHSWYRTSFDELKDIILEQPELAKQVDDKEDTTLSFDCCNLLRQGLSRQTGIQ
jgi:RNA processing factor Prp31